MVLSRVEMLTLLICDDGLFTLIEQDIGSVSCHITCKPDPVVV